ncbi:Acid phosphatase 1 [Acorus gramineus]|uniref:Acid phosphatase 1 n=1 Tax=Acorus gramineus TaxID=55184 RepID=A0AAV9APG3_ACOGR|nr:Acid phosphatase 1 [Acorus gramineus]
MKPSRSLLLLLLLTLFTSPSLSRPAPPSLLRLPIDRPRSRSAARRDCESWRFTVETNDAVLWKQIPGECEAYVEAYLVGERYAADSRAVAEESLAFAEESLAFAAGESGRAGTVGGSDAWVFDVDETLLSNLPYYAENGYGAEIFNETSFDEWVNVARAPALQSSLGLYQELQNLGITIILLTGRSEFQRNATEQNMLFAGYRSWERLILRQDSDMGKSAVVYKSERRAELVSEGYRILGNSGDQWSDLLGFALAKRSFKLPNPMYYIA